MKQEFAETVSVPGPSRRTTALVEERRSDVAAQASGWCISKGKRCFDLAVSVPTLVALAPVMGLVACAIKFTSRGPALFRQQRVGLYQQPFYILKFRTMTHHVGDESQRGPRVTRHGDPRMTRIGGLLRRLKLDELPQLVNVIRGEMSLVGPRPKVAEHEKMYLTCRPGVTGAATLVFSHEEAMIAHIPEEFAEQYVVSVLNPIKLRLDSEYVEKATIRTDLRILAGTIFKLKKRAGGVEGLDEVSLDEIPFDEVNLDPAPVYPEVRMVENEPSFRQSLIV